MHGGQPLSLPGTARGCLFSLPCATAPSPLLANRARLSSAVHGGRPLSLPGAADALSLRDRRTLPVLKCAAFPFPRWSAHSRRTSPPGDNPRFCNHPIQRRTGKRRPTKGRQKGRAERSAANPNVHRCAGDNWIASAPRPANGPPRVRRSAGPRKRGTGSYSGLFLPAGHGDCLGSPPRLEDRTRFIGPLSSGEREKGGPLGAAKGGLVQRAAARPGMHPVCGAQQKFQCPGTQRRLPSRPSRPGSKEGGAVAAAGPRCEEQRVSSLPSPRRRSPPHADPGEGALQKAGTQRGHPLVSRPAVPLSWPGSR